MGMVKKSSNFSQNKNLIKLTTKNKKQYKFKTTIMIQIWLQRLWHRNKNWLDQKNNLHETSRITLNVVMNVHMFEAMKEWSLHLNVWFQQKWSSHVKKGELFSMDSPTWI
jgi:hypothetical protein